MAARSRSGTGPKGVPRDRKGRPLGRRGRVTTAIRGERRKLEASRLEDEATKSVYFFEASAALREALELLSRATSFLRLAGVEPEGVASLGRASRAISEIRDVAGDAESGTCWRRSQFSHRESAGSIWLRAAAESGDVLAVAAMNRGVGRAMRRAREEMLELTPNISNSMSRSLAAIRKERLRAGGAVGEMRVRLDEELYEVQCLGWLAAATCVTLCMPEVMSRFELRSRADGSLSSWSEAVEARLVQLDQAAQRWQRVRATYAAERSLAMYCERLDRAHEKMREPIALARNAEYRRAVTAFDDVGDWISTTRLPGTR